MPIKLYHSPDYLRLDPLGRVPILQEGDLTMAESGAMVAVRLESRPAYQKALS